ncbi:hypothetical protein [Microbulbifer agarilyticus]|uniref:hypothetical protein n=1 Tax=Microbulbifer agarilyticus TaxID=260552 RepID=UPI001C954A01|nr:hypothetical protein [Microbulbifer agarilyticus]MBY6212738.1 hypothetical protein [Microbulbifer agarilyticus]MCA0894352.1 hypothetical protein [Microbulbifer agarilyticus]
MLGLLLLPTSSTLLADDIFIPDSDSALNLQADNAFFTDSAFGMDNEALYESAENLRNNSMGMVHRRLNHQWLEQHTRPSDYAEKTGGRAVNEILKMGFKTYMAQHKRNKQHPLLRYTQSEGKFSNVLDYDFRLSDDKFKFTFEYEF